jgi:hypothetical protein
LAAKYNTIEITPHKEISGCQIQRPDKKNNPTKPLDNTIWKLILQHNQADTHCVVLLHLDKTMCPLLPAAMPSHQARHLSLCNGFYVAT